MKSHAQIGPARSRDKPFFARQAEEGILRKRLGVEAGNQIFERSGNEISHGEGGLYRV